MQNELILKLIEMLLGNKSEQTTQQPCGQHIVVLDRGFVYVGEITLDADWVCIKNARNIRVWGTKTGLGELRNGPLAETVLDTCGEVLAPRKALISLIPCKGF